MGYALSRAWSVSSGLEWEVGEVKYNIIALLLSVLKSLAVQVHFLIFFNTVYGVPSLCLCRQHLNMKRDITDLSLLRFAVADMKIKVIKKQLGTPVTVILLTWQWEIVVKSRTMWLDNRVSLSCRTIYFDYMTTLHMWQGKKALLCPLVPRDLL